MPEQRGHESVGIPPEEAHDLGVSEPHGVVNDTSSHRHDVQGNKHNKKVESSARTQVRKKAIKKMSVCFPKQNKP